jgi:hypothetical protein
MPVVASQKRAFPAVFSDSAHPESAMRVVVLIHHHRFKRQLTDLSHGALGLQSRSRPSIPTGRTPTAADCPRLIGSRAAPQRRRRYATPTSNKTQSWGPLMGTSVHDERRA